MLIYRRLGYLRLVCSFEGVFYIDFCRYYIIVRVYVCVVCVCMCVYVYHMFFDVSHAAKHCILLGIGIFDNIVDFNSLIAAAGMIRT